MAKPGNLRIQLFFDPDHPLESDAYAALKAIPLNRRAAVAKSLIAQALFGGGGARRRSAATTQNPLILNENLSPSRREIPPDSTAAHHSNPAWASAPAAAPENHPEPQQTQALRGASVARRALGQFAKLVSDSDS